jgi:TonB family protein
MTVAACPAQEVPQNPSTAPAATAISPAPEQRSDSAEAGDAKQDATVYNVGGSVQPPVAIHKENPKFSKQVKEARFSGQVLVSLIVGSDGNPRNVHVLRGVGMGLDEKAVEAVQQYKFKPALKHGKPVAVYLIVEVNFQTF